MRVCCNRPCSALLMRSAGAPVVAGVLTVRQLEQGSPTPAAMNATPAKPTPAPVSSSPSARNLVLTKGAQRTFRGRGPRRRPPDRVPGRHRRVAHRAARERGGAARHLSAAERLHRQGQHRQRRDQGGAGADCARSRSATSWCATCRRSCIPTKGSASTCSACRSSRACAGRTSAASSCWSSRARPSHSGSLCLTRAAGARCSPSPVPLFLTS